MALSENVNYQCLYGSRMSTSLQREPTKPNESNKPEGEREQTKFAKPEEQSMVQLENMSQKNLQSRVYTDVKERFSLGGISLEHSLSEEVPVKKQHAPYILSRCINLLISLGSFSTSPLFCPVPLYFYNTCVFIVFYIIKYMYII